MIATAGYRQKENNSRILLIICMVLVIFSGCNTKISEGINGLRFTLMSSGETNIDFNNKITESDSVNVYDNEYMYNGSGVGIGDFNNDGLPDIFFGGSMVSCKLYLNKGNFKFEDVTEKAGLQTNQWCTGVSVVDINNDGFMDIYVCSSHSHDKEKRKNLLFINDGKLHFSEQAAAYGLADTGYSTQAAFLDYDGDGDLDMYLLNHRLYYNAANNIAARDTSGNSPAEDRLYRNDGVAAGQSHCTFHDVSNSTGIKEDGYGLGIVVTDVNNDNWPDIYVANDYIGNDLLWLNNRNGTFSNIIASSMRHESYNSMGADAADINNDGLCDLAVMDMMPENNERKKLMFNASSQEKYDMQMRMKYEPEFVRNVLQLNNGLRNQDSSSWPFYSEIGQLAGMSETNWSWSVLLADFDNDGWKDMHITNGLAKDVTNNDYAIFKNAHSQSGYTFAGNASVTNLDKKTIDLMRDNLDAYGSIKVDNYFFRNNCNLTFSDATAQTGLANPSISNGAAYADLDNDGDLDLVVNNMNQEAFIYRNEMRRSVNDTVHNFLSIQLVAPGYNRQGFQSKVTLYNKGQIQFLEQSPVRGFSSAVDYRLHFGIEKELVVDSLLVQWPDGKAEVLRNIKANRFLTVRYEDAKKPLEKKDTITSALFTDVAEKLNIDFLHKESKYFDFGTQRGLPQKYSQLGPCLTVGDMNGDGLEDFFVGGASFQSGQLFFQKASGTFTQKDLINGPKPEEDVACVLFDSDGDKDLDLLVTGGSAEFGPNSPVNSFRLYINDGKGNFSLNKSALPAAGNVISQAVSVADYDGDGDLDVFIGGRVTPEKYPASPRSYILQNNKGIFTDVTASVCPALQQPGMLTSAIWTDFNNDHKPDLVICGEWMPVRFFANNNGKLNEVTNTTGLTNANGLWRSLQAVDLDNDGDMDYVAGNMGLNNKYHTAKDRPMMFYAKDVDKNGYTDLFPAYYIKDKDDKYDLFPGLDRTQLAEEVPSVKKKYLLHEDYAKVNMQQLVNDYGADGWTTLKCETMQSAWIENLGNGKFKGHPLPLQAQFAPLNSVVAMDADHDGNIDLVIAGNEYQTDVATGRYDASYGLVLKGDGKGNFAPVNLVKSGFIIDGDVKDMKVVNVKGRGKIIVAAINDDKLKCFAGPFGVFKVIEQ